MLKVCNAFVFLTVCLTLAAAPCSAARFAGASPPAFLHEYTLPLGTYPSSITSGPDGALWFSTYPYFTNHPPINLGVARITLKGGVKYFRFGKGTYDIVAGHDGKLWWTNPYTSVPTVGSITTSGQIQQYSVPGKAGSPESIAVDAAGDLWYTSFGGSPDIVRMKPNGQIAATYTSPQHYAVKVAPDNGTGMWFDETSAPYSFVGRIGAHALREAAIVGPNYIPGNMVAGPDGRMWMCDGSSITAVTSAFQITIYPLPANRSCASITTAGDGNLWATDSQSSAILRITTAGIVTAYSVPTPNMIPSGLALGPDNNLWYTEIQQSSDISKIGVLRP